MDGSGEEVPACGRSHPMSDVRLVAMERLELTPTAASPFSRRSARRGLERVGHTLAKRPGDSTVREFRTPSPGPGAAPARLDIGEDFSFLIDLAGLFVI